MGASRSVAAKHKAAEQRKECLRVEIARAKATKNRAKNRRLRKAVEEECIQQQVGFDSGNSESTGDSGYERSVSLSSSNLALKVEELTSGRGRVPEGCFGEVSYFASFDTCAAGERSSKKRIQTM